MGKGENVHCNLIRTRLTCSWLRVLSRNEELKTSHVLPACLHDVMGTFFLILFIRQCVERDEREIKKRRCALLTNTRSTRKRLFM